MKTLVISFNFTLMFDIKDEIINNPSLTLDEIKEHLTNMEDNSTKLDYTITEVTGDIKPEYALELIGNVV